MSRERDVDDAGVDDLEQRAEGDARRATTHLFARACRHGLALRERAAAPRCHASGAPQLSRVDGELDAHAGAEDDVRGSSSRRTRTGTRCTTFVKLPVALSGGRSVKRAPVAPEKLSTVAAGARAGERVDLEVAGWPGCIVADLRLLEVRRDPASVAERAARWPARVRASGRRDRLLRDDAVLRREHSRVLEVERARSRRPVRLRRSHALRPLGPSLLRRGSRPRPSVAREPSLRRLGRVPRRREV